MYRMIKIALFFHLLLTMPFSGLFVESGDTRASSPAEDFSFSMKYNCIDMSDLCSALLTAGDLWQFISLSDNKGDHEESSGYCHKVSGMASSFLSYLVSSIIYKFAGENYLTKKNLEITGYSRLEEHPEAFVKQRVIYILFAGLLSMFAITAWIFYVQQRRKAYYGERRKAQLALLNRELQNEKEKLRVIFESTSTGIWEADIPRHQIKFSQQGGALLGLDNDHQTIGFDRFFSMIVDADRSRIMQVMLHPPLSTWSGIIEEFQVISEDPQKKWLQIRSMAPRFDNDSLQQLAGTITDVTESWVYRHHVIQSEIMRVSTDYRYWELFRSSIDGVFRLDKNGVLLEMNEAFQQLTGYDFRELTGKYFDDLIFHKIRIDDNSGETYMHNNENNLGEFECEMVHANGAHFWVNTKIWSVGVDVNDAESWGIMSDITQRKKSDRELESRENYLRDVMKTTSTGFFVLNADLLFVDVNPAFCEMTGYTWDELGHRNILDFSISFSPDDFFRQIDNFKREGNTILDARFMRKDQTVVDLEVTASYNKKYDRIIGFCLDITARIERKSKLSAALQHLEKLNHYKTWARENEQANLAKEIREVLGQPVTALGLDLVWIQNNLNKKEVCIDRLVQMTSYADGIIRSIQRITGDLRPGILDDLGLQTAIAWYCNGFFERTGIEYSLHLGSEYHTNPAIELAVYRVFQDAMTNVAMHSNASWVHIELNCTQNEFNMSILDNGSGIPKEALLSNESYGLIGMSERMSLMGGSITFLPNIPCGTVVSLNIPIAKDLKI
jgi:PAS domain S-box-containing protein